MSKYNACMEADTHRAKVQAHLQEGERRHVQQTPTFIIGDKLYPGALPYDAFRKLLDSALTKLPAATDSSARGGTTAPATDSAKAPAAGAR